jgi:hypothetical protein
MDNIYGEDIKKKLDKIIKLLERVANAFENSNKGKAGIASQSIEIARQIDGKPSAYKHPAFVRKGKEKEK